MLRSEKKFVDELLKAGKRFPQELSHHSPSTLLRSLRKRLRMTQKQLSKRTGVPQSYIARIESGKTKMTLETLEKLFRGLDCSLSILPIPEKMPDEILEQQAYAAAAKRVKYVAGTMALEDQLPTQAALSEMIEDEKNKLLNSETTKIWD